MGRIWSDQRKYETWLQVEVAAVEAMARAGIVPADAARDIRDKGAFDIARIDAIEQVTQHDVIAFTTSVAEHVGPSARWLHFGLTSSDVIDTAQAIQMRDACDLLLKNVDVLMEAVHRRAEEHRRTPMIGRTHGVLGGRVPRAGDPDYRRQRQSLQRNGRSRSPPHAGDRRRRAHREQRVRRETRVPRRW